MKNKRGLIWKICLVGIIILLGFWIYNYKIVGQKMLLDKANQAYDAKDYQAAVDYYTKAAKKGELNTDVLYKFGLANYSLANLDDSANNYNKILEVESGNYQALNNLGNIYRDQGEYGKAKEYYLKALAINPKLKLTYKNLAFLLKMQNQFEEAIKVLESGIEKIEDKDDKISLYFDLGSYYDNNKQKDMAKDTYKKIVELDPSNQQAKDYLEKLK